MPHYRKIGDVIGYSGSVGISIGVHPAPSHPSLTYHGSPHSCRAFLVPLTSRCGGGGAWQNMAHTPGEDTGT